MRMPNPSLPNMTERNELVSLPEVDTRELGTAYWSWQELLVTAHDSYPLAQKNHSLFNDGKWKYLHSGYYSIYKHGPFPNDLDSDRDGKARHISLVISWKDNGAIGSNTPGFVTGLMMWDAAISDMLITYSDPRFACSLLLWVSTPIWSWSIVFPQGMYCQKNIFLYVSWNN